MQYIRNIKMVVKSRAVSEIAKFSVSPIFCVCLQENENISTNHINFKKSSSNLTFFTMKFKTF